MDVTTNSILTSSVETPAPVRRVDLRNTRVTLVTPKTALSTSSPSPMEEVSIELFTPHVQQESAAPPLTSKKIEVKQGLLQKVKELAKKTHKVFNPPPSSSYAISMKLRRDAIAAWKKIEKDEEKQAAAMEKQLEPSMIKRTQKKIQARYREWREDLPTKAELKEGFKRIPEDTKFILGGIFKNRRVEPLDILPQENTIGSPMTQESLIDLTKDVAKAAFTSIGEGVCDVITDMCF